MTAFHDIPRDAYPMTITFFKAKTGEVVHVIEVPGPGAIQIPGLAGEHGPIGVTMTMANGTSETTWPEGYDKP